MIKVVKMEPTVYYDFPWGMKVAKKITFENNEIHREIIDNQSGFPCCRDCLMKSVDLGYGFDFYHVSKDGEVMGAQIKIRRVQK